MMRIAHKAAERATEGVVVIRQYASGGTWKWPLAIILTVFIAGAIVDWRYGTASFREFKIAAAEMQRKQDVENQRLSAQLDALRSAHRDAEEVENRDNVSFDESLGPNADLCRVPAGPLNRIIARANE